MKMIGKVSDDRVHHRVDHEGQHDRESDPGVRQAEHLVVVEEQEEREAVVLDAEGDGTEAVEQLGGEIEAQAQSMKRLRAPASRAGQGRQVVLFRAERFR
jgi:hypothetical protein